MLDSLGKVVDGLEISSSFFEKYDVVDSDEVEILTKDVLKIIDKNRY